MFQKYPRILPVTGLFALALLFCLPASAQEPLLQQMKKVNVLWEQQPDVAHLSSESTNLQEHRELIQLHLQLVEQTLRTRSTSHLTPAQQESRNQHLDHLADYWASEAFPINTSHSYQLPIFIDPFDNFCAVGHLLKSSDSEELARKIQDSQNFSYLADIHQEGLEEWVSASGLTADELAWIQPGYSPNHIVTPMSGGVSGTINSSAIDPVTGDIIFAGNFDHAGGVSGYGNLARYGTEVGNTGWIGTLNGGVQGVVYAVAYFNGDLIVAGDITSAGSVSVSNIARFDGSQWHAFGTLSAPVNSLQEYNGELYAGGSFISPSLLDPFAYLAKWDGGNWAGAVSSPTGPVNDLALHDGKLAIGGNFAGVLGTPGTQNIALYDGTTFYAVGGGVPLEVNAVTSFQNELVVGGEFSDGTDTLGLSTYNGSTWELTTNNLGFNFSKPIEIHSLLSFSNRIIAGGDFEMSSGLTYGSDLMEVYQGYAFPLAFADTNSEVRSMLITSTGRLFIGGTFSTLTGVTVNNVAQLDFLTSVEDPLANSIKISLFPNPASEQVIIDAEVQVNRVELTNANGQPVLVFDNPNRPLVVDAEQLAPGLYMVACYADGKLIENKKLIIN